MMCSVCGFDATAYLEERFTEDFGVPAFLMVFSKENVVKSRDITVSKLEKRATDCNNWACASSLIFLRYSPFLRGDMARGSSGAKVSPPSWISSGGSAEEAIYASSQLRLRTIGAEDETGSVAFCSEFIKLEEEFFGNECASVALIFCGDERSLGGIVCRGCRLRL